MAYTPVEEQRIYRRAELLADAVWQTVEGWPWMAAKTVGVQWIRAADSVGANIAEARGRHHLGEVRQFLYYARGSLRETKYWLRRALRRGLIDEAQGGGIDTIIERLSAEINSSIKHQKMRRAQEPQIGYDADPTISPSRHRSSDPSA